MSEEPDGRTLRVLLVSPLRGVDPLSGDVTYTEQLLSSPPPGVVYTTYADALARGDLVEHGTRRAVERSRGRDRMRELLFAVWRKAEGAARAAGVGYRERIRHFSVAEGRFDLVHVHVFHHRVLGAAPPVIASAAGPLSWLYADAWGWSSRRIAVAETFDRIVGGLWDATMCARRPGRAARTVAFSDDLRRWLAARSWDMTSVDIVPNYLDIAQGAPPPSDRARAPRRLGFVAKDFVAKGGEVLLEAFEDLRTRHPELELLIVGSPPRLSPDECARRGVTWLPFVERQRLLDEVLPTIDLDVYPSLCDGLPYGPMEALASGIPLVVSDYRALPELVGSDAGRSSRVGDAASVATAVEALLDPGTWSAASRAATARFTSRFSSTSQAPRLRAAYDAATAGPGPRPSRRPRRRAA